MRKNFSSKYRNKYAFIIFTLFVAIYVIISQYGGILRNRYRNTLPESEMEDYSITVQHQDRIKRLQSVCWNISNGETNNILIYPAKRISYCVVPKSACSYWLRIMRFLNNDTGSKHVTSPFELTSQETHSMPYKQTLFRLDNEEQKLAVFNTTRFMVSRNPYTKLLSGYIDKIYLPGHWLYRGIPMIKTVRRKPSNFSLSCGHDLTFQEFLDFLLIKRNNIQEIDGHYRPTHLYCSPCIFKPQFIVRLETFQRDSQFLLKQFDLQYLTKTNHSKSHTLDEIRSHVIGYYDWIYQKDIKRCIDKDKYMARIWKAFQINGYIREDSDNVIQQKLNSTMSKEEFLELVLQNIHSGRERKTKMRQQRHDMMVKMYRSVPRKTLEQIADMFHDDFELFDYEKYPKEIFT